MRALVLLVLAAALCVPLAGAHGTALQTMPEAGARLATAPTEVWVQLNEPAEPGTLKLEVFDARMQRLDAGDLRVDGLRAIVSFAPHEEDAGYLAHWEMVSTVDGHKTSGSWSFAVGAALVPDAGPGGADGFSWLVVLAKGFAFVGLALVGGVVATRAYALREEDAAQPTGERLRNLGLWGAGLHVAGLLLYLAGQASVAGLGVVEHAAGTTFGRGLLLRLGLALVLAVLLALPGAWRLWRGAALAATLAATLLAYGAFSHTAAKLGVPLGTAVDAVHLAAIFAWTGGLACLAVLFAAEKAPSRVLADAGRRFSALATACVAAMAVTGAVMLVAVLGMDPRAWPAYLGTGYGWFLLAMTLLGLVMVALGARNRFVHLARFVASLRKDARGAFGRTMAREAGVGAVVLVVAAVLTNLSPTLVETVRAEAPSAEEVLATCQGQEDEIDCMAHVLMAVQNLHDSVAAFDLLSDMTLLNATVSKHGHHLGHELGANALRIHGDIRETLETCSDKVYQSCQDGALQEWFVGLPVVDEPVVAGVCDYGSKFENFSCIHGVGHGLMLAFRFDLNATLGGCDWLTTDENRNLCYQGVFMEYLNLYPTGNATEVDPEHVHFDMDFEPPVPPRDPFHPCNDIPAKYRTACWLYQPQVIARLNGYDMQDLAIKCDAVSPDYNMTCYHSMGGYVSGRTDGNPKSASYYCGMALTFEGRRDCVRGFIGAIIENTVDPVQGLARCRAIEDQDKPACYQALGASGASIVGPRGMVSVCAEAGSHESTCRRAAGLRA